MGAFGSVLGGFMTMGGIFLSIWVTWTITSGMIGFLLFLLFGILGGMALGSLNSRKARTREKYKNEYTAYAAMMFAAIILLGVFYFVSAIDKITANNQSNMEDSMVLVLAMLGGILTWMGLGLVIANMLAENRGY